VQHWLYFPTDDTRSSFRQVASDAGFKIASETTSEAALPFAISVVRAQPIDQQSINNTALELLSLCRNTGGEYDGWEAPVITQ
jgi:hypothetical protein